MRCLFRPRLHFSELREEILVEGSLHLVTGAELFGIFLEELFCQLFKSCPFQDVLHLRLFPALLFLYGVYAVFRQENLSAEAMAKVEALD